MNFANSLTNDITQFIEYVHDLEEENEKLKEMNNRLLLDSLQKDCEIKYLEEKLSESRDFKASN